MKTIRKVEIEPVFVEFIPKELEDGKLYISEEYGCAIHNCLCGCGGRTITPLDCIIDGKDLGWHLIKHNDGKISLTPSILNSTFDCKSHYIITKNIANFV